jgi:hypothetical protein
MRIVFVDLSRILTLFRESRDIRLRLPHGLFQGTFVGDVTPLEDGFALVTSRSSSQPSVQRRPESCSALSEADLKGRASRMVLFNLDPRLDLLRATIPGAAAQVGSAPDGRVDTSTRAQ